MGGVVGRTLAAVELLCNLAAEFHLLLFVDQAIELLRVNSEVGPKI